MYETSKAVMRRLHEPGFVGRYFVGEGIDIGCGPDPISRYSLQFPLMEALKSWDLPDGDAQLMAGVDDESFDFVHSSHCLEHVHDPVEALANWFRILRPYGHLVVIVPEEDLYEQGVWPSTFNPDHKSTFTIWKPPGASWSPASVNVLELLQTLGPRAEILKIQRLEAGYFFHQARMDQTQLPTGECAIEFVVRKREA